MGYPTNLQLKLTSQKMLSPLRFNSHSRLLIFGCIFLCLWNSSLPSQEKMHLFCESRTQNGLCLQVRISLPEAMGEAGTSVAISSSLLNKGESTIFLRSKISQYNFHINLAPGNNTEFQELNEVMNYSSYIYVPVAPVLVRPRPYRNEKNYKVLQPGDSLQVDHRTICLNWAGTASLHFSFQSGSDGKCWEGNVSSWAYIKSRIGPKIRLCIQKLYSTIEQNPKNTEIQSMVRQCPGLIGTKLLQDFSKFDANGRLNLIQILSKSAKSSDGHILCYHIYQMWEKNLFNPDEERVIMPMLCEAAKGIGVIGYGYKYRLRDPIASDILNNCDTNDVMQ